METLSAIWVKRRQLPGSVLFVLSYAASSATATVIVTVGMAMIAMPIIGIIFIVAGGDDGES